MKSTSHPQAMHVPLVVALPKELLRNEQTTDRAFRLMVTLITMAKKKARTIEITQDKLAEAMHCTVSTVYRATREAEKFYGLTMDKWTTPDRKQHIRYEIPRFRGGLTYVQKQVVYGIKKDCDLRTYLVLKSAEHKVKTKYVRRSTAWVAKKLGIGGATPEKVALRRIRSLGDLVVPRSAGGTVSHNKVVTVSLYDEAMDLSPMLEELYGGENGNSDDRHSLEEEGTQMTDISTLSNDKKEKDWQLQGEDLKDLEDQKPKLTLITPPVAAAWPEVVIPGSGGMKAPNLGAPKSLWRKEDGRGSGSGSGVVSGS